MEDFGKRITAPEALQLVSSFFEIEWPKTTEKDVSIRKVTGGFVNTLHLLSRSTPAKNEPPSVLIRHFGRTKDLEDPAPGITTLSAAEQAIVYHEMGRRGWGPKLYGVFPGGRLEEYLDAHTLTADESTEPKIRQDIARSYARIHSLQLPLRKQNFKQVVLELENNMAKKESLVRDLLKYGGQEARDLAQIIEITDWTLELGWVSSLFTKLKCKQTIAIGDANYLNILVKNTASDCMAVLIDYETATYSYRGIDIGGHFNERMYDWGNSTSCLTGYPSADIDEQRSFCTAYLREMQALGHELTANDSLSHLLLESEIGRMYQLLFSVCMSFQQGVPEELLKMPGVMAGLTHMMETYRSLKQRFVEKHNAG